MVLFFLPSFRYMEEVIESTLSLLSFHHEHGSTGTEKALEPIHLLALIDVKATWFNKWMVCMETNHAGLMYIVYTLPGLFCNSN